MNAAAALRRFNPHIATKSVGERLTPQNAATLVGGADLVIDAADSFAHPAYEAALVAAARAKPLLRIPGDRRHANRARITARWVDALMSQLRMVGRAQV